MYVFFVYYSIYSPNQFVPPLFPPLSSSLYPSTTLHPFYPRLTFQQIMGMQNVNHTFFPLLDRNKRAFPARIINCGSEVSWTHLSTAFSSLYASSKIAVEYLSIGLRQEMSMLPVPVKVVVINPGIFSWWLRFGFHFYSHVFVHVPSISFFTITNSILFIIIGPHESPMTVTGGALDLFTQASQTSNLWKEGLLKNGPAAVKYMEAFK